MSKKVKSLVTRELKKRLSDVEGVAVISRRGINGNRNHAIRRKLHEQGLKMTVVRNTLVKRATEGSKLAGFEKLLVGPSAVVYGKARIPPISRLLMAENKTDANLELRAAFF